MHGPTAICSDFNIALRKKPIYYIVLSCMNEFHKCFFNQNYFFTVRINAVFGEDGE